MGAPFGAFVAAHLPQRLLVVGILLLVTLETATTILFVMVGSQPAVWLIGLATLLVTIASLTVMLQRRRGRS
jgi:hypothetical protein